MVRAWHCAPMESRAIRPGGPASHTPAPVKGALPNAYRQHISQEVSGPNGGPRRYRCTPCRTMSLLTKTACAILEAEPFGPGGADISLPVDWQAARPCGGACQSPLGDAPEAVQGLRHSLPGARHRYLHRATLVRPRQYGSDGTLSTPPAGARVGCNPGVGHPGRGNPRLERRRMGHGPRTDHARSGDFP
jgi:hypothetical protein